MAPFPEDAEAAAVAVPSEAQLAVWESRADGRSKGLAGGGGLALDDAGKAEEFLVREKGEECLVEPNKEEEPVEEEEEEDAVAAAKGEVEDNLEGKESLGAGKASLGATTAEEEDTGAASLVF